MALKTAPRAESRRKLMKMFKKLVSQPKVRCHFTLQVSTGLNQKVRCHFTLRLRPAALRLADSKPQRQNTIRKLQNDQIIMLCCGTAHSFCGAKSEVQLCGLPIPIPLPTVHGLLQAVQQLSATGQSPANTTQAASQMVSGATGLRPTVTSYQGQRVRVVHPSTLHGSGGHTSSQLHHSLFDIFTAA